MESNKPKRKFSPEVRVAIIRSKRLKWIKEELLKVPPTVAREHALKQIQVDPRSGGGPDLKLAWLEGILYALQNTVIVPTPEPMRPIKKKDLPTPGPHDKGCVLVELQPDGTVNYSFAPVEAWRKKISPDLAFAILREGQPMIAMIPDSQDPQAHWDSRMMALNKKDRVYGQDPD